MASGVDRSLVDFPFLTDDNTVKHVERSKVMFIMRGLPGSGKSTVVRIITEKYKTNATVCSADDHFLQEDGSYLFDKEKLSQAHEECQRKASEACETGTHAVIIDNTNVRRWELSHYTKLASTHSYVTILVSPKTPWRFDAVQLAKLNKHGVDQEKIQKKIKSYERIFPLYYGWFLNETGSASLKEKATTYFEQCLKLFPEFASTVKENARSLGVGIEFSNYFTRETSSSETFHSTAFFALRGRTKSCQAYSSQDAVKRSLGKSFTLKIVGFVITPRTVGARIALTPRQARLWGKDDYEGSPGKSDGFTVVTDSPRYRRRGQGSPDINKAGKSSPKKSNKKAKQRDTSSSNPFSVLGVSDSENTASNDSDANDDGADTAKYNNDDTSDTEGGDHSDVDIGNYSPDDEDYEEMLAFEMGYVKLTERPRFMPTCGLGSRAHITVGYSQGTKAVQTGLDQIKVIEMEEDYHRNHTKERPPHVELDDAAAIQYGNGQCVVYLNDPISVDTLFSGRY